ncbi:hypothetical protein ACO0LF_18120 [Undibacterium sp. Di27W]|uniref:hypothetical protein n=1 Tax=Undibacterium sp. Di27W TaxID=3413036 RepID=UPI003BF03AAE
MFAYLVIAFNKLAERCIRARLYFAVLVLPLCACATQNFDLEVYQGLRVGMSQGEANKVLDRLEAAGPPFVRRVNDTVGSKCVRYPSLCQDGPDSHLFDFYRAQQFPYDVLKQVSNGTPFFQVDYLSGPGMRCIYLFFDPNTQLLRGWVANTNLWSLAYWQERLGSKLKREYGRVSHGHTKKAEVYALIGPPKTIIATPTKMSRELLDDHYWDSMTLDPPTGKWSNRWEVYEYLLEDGAVRHVYMIYAGDNNSLTAYGYDHAHLEVERFKRARGF